MINHLNIFVHSKIKLIFRLKFGIEGEERKILNKLSLFLRNHFNTIICRLRHLKDGGFKNFFFQNDSESAKENAESSYRSHRR